MARLSLGRDARNEKGYKQMTTEEWLIEQKEHATKALEAYQLLYAVYLDICYDDYGKPCISSRIDDKIEDFFDD